MTNIVEQIKYDWPDGSPVAQACLEIWQCLSGKKRQLDHYTYGDLESFTAIDDRACLTRAMMYLATPSIGVLKTALLYESNGTLLELPDEEVAHFAAGQQVIHPQLGESIPDDQVFLAFEPGRQLVGGSAS